MEEREREKCTKFNWREVQMMNAIIIMQVLTIENYEMKIMPNYTFRLKLYIRITN